MEIKTPDLGVDSAEVSEIMVNVGDVINKDDNIVLLESDKASVEVPSSAAGTVKSILVSVGDTVSEGVVLLDIEAGETAQPDETVADEAPKQVETTEQPANVEQTEAPVANASAAEVTHALPDLGVDEAEVAEIMVKEGDLVEAEQSILLVESDKASVEVPAPASGKVVKLLVNAGDTVSNGQAFIVIEGAASSGAQASTEPAQVTQEPKTATVQNTQATTSQQQSTTANTSADTGSAKLTEEQVNAKLAEVYAGPAVRKLARQLGVDVTQVTGSGKNNRVQKDDLFAFVKQRMQQPVAQKTAASGVSATLPTLPDMSKTELWGEIERMPLSRLQKVSIPQLNYNTLIPQVTQFDASDITETEKFRGSLKAQYKAEGISLTILSFIIKVTAHALLKFPKFNSHLSDDNTELLLRKTVNMGIAVATDNGLIVPVIKNAQDKSIREISIEVGELAKKARDNKLTPKDITGASFTISSLGNMGGSAFTPLVTWPQVGILGISDASMQPRWNAASNEFEPRLMLPLSMSYDHRVINGADAAIFTRYVANVLADPRKVLLD
ncbi:dihydrolipoyllysine-residue acetyltransferase [Psychrobacter sp. HD31]|uniref:dihydrolipoyllysine-residue acetyltransferase n=1 Tax=Psychrobacter sp. HD31 TaxID=3112003 RepID=UPI003DA39562